ncbi:MAG: hypothetical protein LBL73_10790 [Synergistaceae bacterium]|nr:hypothetical protein [Synergistaceae bacterium]
MTIRNRITENPPVIGYASSENPLLLNEKLAAKQLGLSLSFLRKSRCEGTVGGRTPAPPFVRIGGRVMYPAEDLRMWVKDLERRTVI